MLRSDWQLLVLFGSCVVLWFVRERLTVESVLLGVGVFAYNLSGLPYCASFFDVDEARARAIHAASPVANAMTGFYTVAWTMDAMARGARGDPTALGAWLAIAPCVPFWMAMTARSFELEADGRTLRRMRYAYWGTVTTTIVGSVGCVVPSLGALPATAASTLEVANRALRLAAPAQVLVPERVGCGRGAPSKHDVDFSPSYIAVWEVATSCLFAWGLMSSCPAYYVAKLGLDVVWCNLHLLALLKVRLARTAPPGRVYADDERPSLGPGRVVADEELGHGGLVPDAELDVRRREAVSTRGPGERVAAATADPETRLATAAVHAVLYETLGWHKWAASERELLKAQPSRRVSGLEVAHGVAVSLSPVVRGYAPALAVPVVDHAHGALDAATMPLDTQGQLYRGAYRAWRQRDDGAPPVHLTPWARDAPLTRPGRAELLAKNGLWECLGRASSVGVETPTARRVLRNDDRPDVAAYRVQYRAWRLLSIHRPSESALPTVKGGRRASAWST